MSRKLTDEEKALRKNKRIAFDQRCSSMKTSMKSRSEELLRSPEMREIWQVIYAKHGEISNFKAQLEQELGFLEEDYKAKKAAILNKFKPPIEELEREEAALQKTLYQKRRDVDVQVREEFKDLYMEGNFLLHWTQWKGFED